MHTLHLIARIALGVVFVVAGASKVASGRAWPSQAAQLEVPGPVALVVPWFELVVGASCTVGIGGAWPIAVAMVTLVAFTAVLVRTLSAGRRPPCACFGAWSAAPLGWRHVARNAAFVAVALVALLTT